MPRKMLPRSGGSGREGAGSLLLETLEPRCLMSTNFTSVGVDFSPSGNSIILIEGVLADDHSVSGTATVATPTGTQTGRAIDIGSLSFGASGTMAITRSAGFAPFASQNGTEFRTTVFDYSLGVHRGTYDAGNGQTADSLRYFIERRDMFDGLRKANTTYAVRTIELTTNGVRYDQDYFKFVFDKGVPVSIWKSDDGTETTAVTKPITSISDDGVISFGNGEKLILGRRRVANGKEEFGLYIDTDSSDGEVSIGTMYSGWAGVQNWLPDNQVPEMIYRGSMLAQTPVARTFFGIDSDAARGQDVVLSIKSDKTYALYKAGDFGKQNAVPLSTGTWDFSPHDSFPAQAPDVGSEQNENSLKLTDSRGQLLAVSLSTAFNMLPSIFQATSAADPERLGGQLVTQAREAQAADVALLMKYADVDGDGNLFVYAQGGSTPDSVWRRFDLIALAGGKQVEQAFVFEQGSNPGEATSWNVIAIARDGDVLLYQVTDPTTNSAVFTFRNLSEDSSSGLFSLRFKPGAAIFLSSFRTDLSSPSNVVIAGHALNGDVVHARGYPAPQPGNPADTDHFVVTNVTAEFSRVGETAPSWSGPTYGYDTYWGAANILYIQEGELHVIWTAPLIDRWYANDLSAIAHAAPVAGTVSTLVTSWRGIHIHALDANGDLHVIWWAPALGGEWIDSDLTSSFGGTSLATKDTDGNPSVLATWISDGSDLNILAMDKQGDVRLYWWDFATLQWTILNVLPDVDGSIKPAKILAPGESGSPGVFARNQSGDFLRTYPTTADNSTWTSVNVDDRLV